MLIVVQESHKADMVGALDKCGLKIKYELVGIPGDEEWGTADSLRHLHEIGKIRVGSSVTTGIAQPIRPCISSIPLFDLFQTDVLIVSSDLVSDLKLDRLIDLYRQKDASICGLFVPSPGNPALITPGPRMKTKTGKLNVILIYYPQHLVIPVNCDPGRFLVKIQL